MWDAPRDRRIDDDTDVPDILIVAAEDTPDVGGGYDTVPTAIKIAKDRKEKGGWV